MPAPTLKVYIQGQGTVGADELNTFLQAGAIASQLRAITGIPGMTIMLSGIGQPNDGNGGWFYWNANGTEVDDNYNYIVPQGNAVGIWERLVLPGQTTGQESILPGTSFLLGPTALGGQPNTAPGFGQPNGVAQLDGTGQANLLEVTSPAGGTQTLATVAELANKTGSGQTAIAPNPTKFLLGPTSAGAQPNLATGNAAGGPPVLDSNSDITGQTTGPNASACLSFAALVSYSPPAPYALVNEQTLGIPNYSVTGDNGGGEFQWHSGSTVQPDTGITICPTFNQTQVTAFSVGTGDGATTVFTVNLTHTKIIPGSVALTAGSVTAADTGGCGILFGAGLVVSTISNNAATLGVPQYQSTVNYAASSSTQLQVTFAVAPTFGTPITVNFAYATGAGRWIRQIPIGVIDIRWFGANTSADLFFAWKAADNYATTNNIPVYIPDAPSNDWKLVTPMVINAPRTEAAGGPTAGTKIVFSPSSPSDLTAAITLAGAGQYLSNINPFGPETIPTVATLVSSGWILTQATFPGTVSGSTLTLTGNATGTMLAAPVKSNGVPTNSISGGATATANCTFSGSVMTAGAGTGTWAVGMTIYGQRLTPCTITSFGTGTGGAGTYNLSAPQTASGTIATIGSVVPESPLGTIYVAQLLTGTLGLSGSTYQLATTVAGATVNMNVSTPVTFTQTVLPNYAAFQAGTAGIAVCNSCIIENCNPTNFKVGTVFWSNFGHAFLNKCIDGGNNLINYYFAVNGGDYWFDECDIQPAIFANILTGNGGPFQNATGGGTSGGGGWSGGMIRCHPGQAPFGEFQVDNGGSIGGGFISAGVRDYIRCSIEGASETFLQTLPNVSVLINWIGEGAGGGITSSRLPITLVPAPNMYGSFIFLGAVQGLSVTSSQSGFGFVPGYIGCAYIASVAAIAGNPYDFDTFNGFYVLGAIGPAETAFNPRDALNYRIRWPVLHEQLARQPQGNGFWMPETVPAGVAPTSGANWTSSNGSSVNLVTLASLIGSGDPLVNANIDYRIYAEYPGVAVNVIAISNSNPALAPTVSLNVNPGWAVQNVTQIALRFWLAASVTGGVNFSLICNNSATAFAQTPQISPTAFTKLGANGIEITDISGATSFAKLNITGVAGQTVYVIAPNLSAYDWAPYNQDLLPQGANFVGDFAVGSLPSAANYQLGREAFATNGRNTGEGASAGTGCPVFVKSISGTNTWCAVWSGVAVTS